MIDRWSYTLLSTYEACPQKYKLRYIDKIPTEKSPAAERGDRIHKQIENYLEGYTDEIAPELSNVAQHLQALKQAGAKAEHAVYLDRAWKPTDKDNRWLTCYLDAFVLNEDETCHIVDFKTGSVYADHVKQMSLYATAIFSSYPITELKSHLIYIDTNEVSRDKFTRYRLADIQTMYTRDIERISNDTKFRKNIGRQCKWCNFHISKGGPCGS